MKIEQIRNEAAEMTDEEVEACVAWLAELPLDELRERQDLIAQQQDIAYGRKLDRAMANLEAMQAHTDAAVWRKTAPVESGGVS